MTLPSYPPKQLLLTLAASLSLVAFLPSAAMAQSYPSSVPPAITAIAPDHGPIGTSITLTGSGFTSTGNTINLSTVNDPTPASGVVVRVPAASSTTFTFAFPATLAPACSFATPSCMLIPVRQAAPGPYDISVTNANGTSNTIRFSLTAAPEPVSSRYRGFGTSGGAITQTTGTLPNASFPSLRLGSRSTRVSDLQRMLATDHTLYPEGLITGYYGKATEQAVKRFQSKYGIVSSGTPASTGYGAVGPKTNAKLHEVLGQAQGGSHPPPASSVFPLPVPGSVPNPFAQPSSTPFPSAAPRSALPSSSLVAGIGAGLLPLSQPKPSPLSLTLSFNPSTYILGDTLQGGGTVSNTSNANIPVSIKVELFQEGVGEQRQNLKWQRDIGVISLAPGIIPYDLRDVFGSVVAIPNDPVYLGNWTLRITMAPTATPQAGPVVVEGRFRVMGQSTGKPVAMTGTLQVLHYDYFDQQRSVNELYLISDSGPRIRLRPTGALGIPALSRERISVSGRLVDNELFFDGSKPFAAHDIADQGGISMISPSPALSRTIGEQKLAVVLVKFPG